MSVQDILRRAKDALSDRKTVAQNRYSDLVRGLAEGEDIEPDGVFEILSAAEKSEDDLQHDVEAFGTRDELARLKTEQAEFMDRKRELVDEIAELQEQIDDLKVKHQTSKDEFRVVSSRIESTTKRRHELLRNFPEAVPEYGEAKERFRHYAVMVNQNIEAKKVNEGHLRVLQGHLDDLENFRFYRVTTGNEGKERNERQKELKQQIKEMKIKDELLADQIEEFSQARDEAKKEVLTF